VIGLRDTQQVHRARGLGRAGDAAERDSLRPHVEKAGIDTGIELAAADVEGRAAVRRLFGQPGTDDAERDGR
jgi:hypothetical protein